MERPPAVRAFLVSRWSVLLPNVGRRDLAQAGPARLSAIITFPLLHISVSKWFVLLSRFYHPPVKCYTLIIVSGYLAEANWMSLINQHSWGWMTAKAVKGHTISFTELGEEVMGLNVLVGERIQSVEPQALSFLLVNLY